MYNIPNKFPLLGIILGEYLVIQFSGIYTSLTYTRNRHQHSKPIDSSSGSKTTRMLSYQNADVSRGI